MDSVEQFICDAAVMFCYNIYLTNGQSGNYWGLWKWDKPFFNGCTC